MPITVQHAKETMCYAHICAAAAMAGINLSASLHDYGVDGHLYEVQNTDGRYAETGLSIDYQAKSTISWLLEDACIVYDLEAKTYNDIVRRGPGDTTLFLILLCLPRNQEEWHRVSDDGMLLRDHCYWHVFGGVPTLNANRIRIRIPVTNRLTPQSMRDLLTFERLRRNGVRP